MLTHEQIEELQRLRQAARLHPPRYAIVPTCDGITLEIRDYYSAVIHCAGVLVDAAARLAEVHSRLDPVKAAECAIPDDSELIVDVLIRKLSELDTARSKLEAEPHARATRLERALAPDEHRHHYLQRERHSRAALAQLRRGPRARGSRAPDHGAVRLMPKVARLQYLPPPAWAPILEPKPTRVSAPEFIVLEHEGSRARRRVQLLAFTESHGHVWWPLCGPYRVELTGRRRRRLIYDNDQPSPWKLVPVDFSRLLRRSPISLYHSKLHR